MFLSLRKWAVRPGILLRAPSGSWAFNYIQVAFGSTSPLTSLVCMCVNTRVFSTSENEHWRGMLSSLESLLAIAPCHLRRGMERWRASVRMGGQGCAAHCVDEEQHTRQLPNNRLQLCATVTKSIMLAVVELTKTCSITWKEFKAAKM